MQKRVSRHKQNNNQNQKLTTIALFPDVYDELLHKKEPKESFNDVVKRLLNDQLDVNVDVVLVDNELPLLHTVVLQVGEDKNSLYLWDGKTIASITPEKVNIMLRRSQTHG